MNLTRNYLCYEYYKKNGFFFSQFSDDIEYLDDCFNFTLVPANTNNKARLRELIDMEIETKEKANFERALIEAFRLSDYFVSIFWPCHDVGVGDCKVPS